MPYNYGGGGSDFDLVPEGTHEFFIDTISERTSKKGRPMVEISLKPSEIAMQKFGKVWHYITLDNEFTESNVGRLLAAMGKDPRRAGRIDFTAFKGEYLTAEIKHREDDYGVKATVKKMLSNFRESDPDDAPTERNEAPMNTNETRECIRGKETPQPPQDEYAGNDPAMDDIPF